MCLAVYKPAGVHPDWDAYSNGFQRNSDGAGFAVVDAGKVRIHKGFFTFDEFKEAFSNFADKQCAVHFRLTSHGKTNADNCHPFKVSDELALIHNGVLNIACDVNASMSDTWHYNRLILRPLAARDRGFYSRPDISFMGEQAIAGSKFVFLRADGDFGIWNESDGHWHGDAWWSNHSYESPFKPVKREVVRYMWADVAPKYLGAEAKWAYEDLSDAGWSSCDLDEYLRDYGEDELRALARAECGEECYR